MMFNPGLTRFNVISGIFGFLLLFGAFMAILIPIGLVVGIILDKKYPRDNFWPLWPLIIPFVMPLVIILFANSLVYIFSIPRVISGEVIAPRRESKDAYMVWVELPREKLYFDWFEVEREVYENLEIGTPIYVIEERGFFVLHRRLVLEDEIYRYLE